MVNISNLVSGVKGLVTANPIASVIGGTAAVTAVALGSAAVLGRSTSGSKTKRKGRKIKHTSRGWKQDRKRKSKQKWEVAYRRRKARKGRRKGRMVRRKGVHYTKNGQPYILMKSGKARFVKKSKRRHT
jgi:hypothetical protein